MKSERKYAPATPYWVRNAADLKKLKIEAGELRDVLAKEEAAGRSLGPVAMRARARLAEVEREVRVAVAPQHDPNTGALLTRVENRPPAPAACRKDMARCRALLAAAQVAVAGTERRVAALRDQLAKGGLLPGGKTLAMNQGGRMYLPPVPYFEM